ncbi:hypothetical protein N566_16935 [Streptomycetaceae bacterium MP113-05]|nr:hypothetical protein N566_16935 [Streptomycetaceae bacterium MP113-05]
MNETPWQGREPKTVVSLLRHRSDRTPEALAYRFLVDTDGTSESWNYADLERRARQVAVRLQHHELRGKPVLLLHPPGLEYIAAFFGCLYAGAVAVPAYPPGNARFGQTMPRLDAMVRDSGATHALTTRSVGDAVRKEGGKQATRGIDELGWITSEETAAADPADWRVPGVRGSSLAFLQYTSGSTSTPKGVMVTHANLIRNLRSSHLRLGHGADSAMVSWLPPYHDMGLIGGILTPLYGGFPSHLMAPTTFVRSPLLWLRTLSETGASTSVAPNFGFEQCVARVTPEQRDGLDLSRWRLALNGAEPVRAETLERFAEYFGPAGFAPEALLPCYGMAEATLMVTGSRPEERPVVCDFDAAALERSEPLLAGAGTERITRVVGCGPAVDDVEIAVVDPETLSRAEGRVGEIWVAGPNVAEGYWGRPEATQEAFAARIEGEAGGPWLRTGDLGFERDGQLYVTGRIKDVVIVQGRNFYPHDIEATAERATDAVRQGNGVAFGIPTADGEQLGLLYEVSGRRALDHGAVLAALRTAIAEEHQVAPHTIALVKHSTVPKTTSGKIQRRAARADFLRFSDDVVAASVSHGSGEAVLPSGALAGLSDAERRARVTEAVAQALEDTCRTGGDDLDGRRFTDLGLDYPRLLAVVRSLELRLGVRVPVGDLLVRQDVGALVQLCLDEESGAGQGESAPMPSPRPVPERASAATGPGSASSGIVAWLRRSIAARLGLPADAVDPALPLASLGLDSKQAVALAQELAAWLGTELPANIVFEHPSVQALAAHLGSEPGPASATVRERGTAPPPGGDEPIAVVGMGCRLPGAPDVAAYWKLLRDGRDAVGEVPLDRWDSGAVKAPPHGGFLDHVDEWDARFFGLSAREASRMDPQQRLLMETAWTCFEDAGIAPARLAGTDTGAFIGISSGDYAQLQLPDIDNVDVYSVTGNAQSIAANRLSYFFDLHGPSMAVDTACSSSLVAVHMACQSIRAGECGVAIAGGVNLLITPGLSVAFSDGRMLGPGGRCRTFDEAADGYVRGEGAGMVCLKPLSAALRDGDRVYATIRGSALGHGGRSNGLTAPKSSSQRTVMTRALHRAGIEAAQIDYVEAHGTGTPLGDPIEWEALSDVYGGGRPDDAPCLVGSAKTNIGHLEAAAGIAGLIKAVLVVQHREVPPLLHLTRPNPRLAWEGSGLDVPTSRRALPGSGTARAGVSSFGFGGSNAHVVIEAVPEAAEARTPMMPSRAAHTLCLSAHTPTALLTLARRYRSHLAAHPDLSAHSLCYSANTTRNHLPHRAALTAATLAEFDDALERLTREEPSTAVARGHVTGVSGRRIAFLFSGQGTQYAGMGAELYAAHPVFARMLDRADEVLSPLLGTSLTSVLFDEDGAERLQATDLCQPALVAIEVALAELWMSLGVRPAAVLGHSVGALSAACVSGALDFEDALRLAAVRGRAMAEQPGAGAMIACHGDAAEVRAVAGDFASVTVAAINTPDHLVLSGEDAEIREIQERLEARGVRVRPLTVSHAFHSGLMAGAAERLRTAAGDIEFRTPDIPWISDATGREAGRVGPDHWVEHMLGTVRFADAFAAVRRTGCDAFAEIGPHPTLLNLGRAMVASGHAPGAGESTDLLWLPSLRRGKSEWETFLQSLARLHCAGGEVDWHALDLPDPPPRVSLPHAVFERERYWFDSAGQEASRDAGQPSSRAPEAASTTPGTAAAAGGSPTGAQVPQHAAVPGMMPYAVWPYGAVPPGYAPFPGYPVAGPPHAVPGMVPYPMAPAGYLPFPPYPAPGMHVPGMHAPGMYPPAVGVDPTAGGTAGSPDVGKAVLETLAQVCGFPADQIASHARLGMDLGLDSLMRTDLQRRIAARFPYEAEQLRHGLSDDPTVQEVLDRLGTAGPVPSPYANGYATPVASGLPTTVPPGPAPGEAAPVVEPAAPTVKPEYTFEEWPEYAELQERLRTIGVQGINPYGRTHEGFNSAMATVDGRKVVNFSSFNYLALSNHPRVMRAAKDAIDTYGTSSSATPLLFGETPLHHELDAEIASFLGTDAAIVFAGGHATNVATVGHLFGPEDLIVHDEWIHDSTVRGCLLSGARRRPFPHNDWEALDRILTTARHRHRRALVVVEGAYSQDGDIPDLPRFIEVKQRHQAMLMIDEAHSIGVLGRTGRGVGEHFGVPPQDVDLWMGTLSKGVGSLGGYIAARQPLIEYLKYTAPLHIFSTGISPANAAAALEALRVIRDEPDRVARLQQLAETFRTGARERGLDIGVSRASAVVPVITGDWENTLALSNALLEKGVNVMPIGYPAVARDACRLRFFVNVDHSEAELEQALDLLV